MKSRFYLTTFLFIFIQSFGIAQMSNETLSETCNNEANYWKPILSMSNSETTLMSKILFNYKSKVRDLPKSIENYREKLQKIELSKQTELTSLLGTSRFKTYNLLNQPSEDFMNHIIEIKSAMKQDSFFISDVSKHMISRYPVLIQYYTKLIDQMSIEDYVELKRLKTKMFHKLDSLNNQNINILDTINGQKDLPLEAKLNVLGISKIISKYEKEYNEIYISLLQQQKKWNQEMEQILLFHYPESNVNSMKEYRLFFLESGINKELDKVLIFLLDPADERRYFQSLMIVQKLEEIIYKINK